MGQLIKTLTIESQQEWNTMHPAQRAYLLAKAYWEEWSTILQGKEKDAIAELYRGAIACSIPIPERDRLIALTLALSGTASPSQEEER